MIDRVNGSMCSALKGYMIYHVDVGTGIARPASQMLFLSI